MASLKTKSPSIRSKSRATAENVVSGIPIGEVLSQARESRGLSLDNVADELMIRRFYLEALEMGSFQDLPERVYAIGFVNNYIKYLGMDEPQAVIEQFKREAYGTRSTHNYRVDLSMPEPVVHSIVPGRSAIASAVVVLVVLIAGIVFFTQSGGEAKKAETIPAPVTAAAPVVDAPAPVAAPAGPVVNTTTTEEPEFTASTNEAPSAATPPVQNAAQNPALAQIKNQRAIEAMQSAWVEIKDAGSKTLYTGILKATQLLPLPDNVKVTLTTGNAGGLRLVINGQPQPAFGQLNEVKRNIMIDVAPVAVPENAPAVQKSAAPATLPSVTFER